LPKDGNAARAVPENVRSLRRELLRWHYIWWKANRDKNAYLALTAKYERNRWLGKLGR
jgi:hypothetical protein